MLVLAVGKALQLLSHMGLFTKGCLNILMMWWLASLRVSILREQSSRRNPLYVLTWKVPCALTSITFHWSSRPALIPCGRGLTTYEHEHQEGGITGGHLRSWLPQESFVTASHFWRRKNRKTEEEILWNVASIMLNAFPSHLTDHVNILQDSFEVPGASFFLWLYVYVLGPAGRLETLSAN